MVREDVNAILFDEPLTVIDPHMKWELRTQLKQLHRQFGHTMIYVTHDQTEALTFADKVVVMYDGRVVQMGTPEELFEAPAHTFVGYFIGSPGMNFLPAEVRGDRATLPGGEVVGLGRGLWRRRRARPDRHPPRTCMLTDRRAALHRPPRRGCRPPPLVRGEVLGQPLNIVVPEGMAGRGLPASPSRPKRSTSMPMTGASRRGKGPLMEKTWNNKAWFLVLPVLVVVAFSAVIPLMTVVNYAFNDTFGNNEFFWAASNGSTRWSIPRTPARGAWPAGAVFRHHSGHRGALGHFRRAEHAEKGLLGQRRAGADGAALADPVQRRRHDLADLRPRRYRPLGHAGRAGDRLQLYQRSAGCLDHRHRDGCLALDQLVALLCYAGLQSIPQAYYQAAKIDQASRWAVFRYIELPKMKGVLLIAVLLRFMDSFMIYTEPFVVTGGGPGNSTTFLSIDLVKMAVGQFDLGPAAAFSLMYFLVILLVSWVFYTVMTNMDRSIRIGDQVMRIKSSAVVMTLYLLFLMLPIYWLMNMSLKTNAEITGNLHAVPATT
jgi:glycerol transport system permease protein